MSQRKTRVEEVMTHRVRTARPEQSLHEIWYLFGDERFHHLPIVDDGGLVGMISSRDLVRAAREQGVSRLSASVIGDLRAEDVMTRTVETIRSDDPVESAIDRIGRGDLHALAVLDAEDELVGIVTDRDLLFFLAR